MAKEGKQAAESCHSNKGSVMMSTIPRIPKPGLD